MSKSLSRKTLGLARYWRSRDRSEIRGTVEAVLHKQTRQAGGASVTVICDQTCQVSFSWCLGWVDPCRQPWRDMDSQSLWADGCTHRTGTRSVNDHSASHAAFDLGRVP
nr:hypothetical protein CFP56_13228 [Quercus suber]